MKHHFLLPCIALLFSVAACSGSDEGDSNVGGSPGSGATAGTSGNVGGTAGSGSSAGGSSAAGTPGAAGTSSAAGSGVGGSSAGAGQGGSSSGGAGAGAGGTATAGAGGGGGGSGGSGGGQAGSAGAGGGAAMTGEALYTSKCAACHGAQGVGGTLGPEIQHPVRDYAAWVVRHGRSSTAFPAPMVAVTPQELSDAALTSIWDYLDSPPQPTTGQALYKDYCANCHGADGKGGPTMRSIVNELGKLKSIVRQGAHPGEFDMRREYMPVFGTDVISNAELDLIYTYVDSL
jgi:mono/diheme cytochrome c family protein